MQFRFTIKNSARARKSTIHKVDLGVWGRVVRDEFYREKNLGTRSVDIFAITLHGTIPQLYRWALSGTPFDRGPIDLVGYPRGLAKQWPKEDEP